MAGFVKPRLGNLLIIAVVTCHLGFVQTTSFQHLEARLTRAMLFQARSVAKADPALSQQVKIISFDDTSVTKLQTVDLTMMKWARLLRYLDTYKPRAIIIDKIFQVAFDPQNEQEKALELLNGMQTPVYVAVFYSRTPILSRTEWLREPAPEGALHLYGPAETLRETFTRVGHINYDGTGSVNLRMQRYAEDLTIPHLGLASFAAPSTWPKTERMVINFMPRSSYLASSARIVNFMDAMEQNAPQNFIATGDTVLILPAMYTGAADLVMSPFGEMPGGFLVASIINSALTGKWIKEVPSPVAFILLFAFFGMLLGRIRKIATFAAVVLLSLVTILSIATGLFIFAAYSWSWLVPTSTLICTAMTGFAFRTLKREKETAIIQAELDEAAEIAKAFLPDPSPQNFPAAIDTLHLPLQPASGDWFAFASDPAQKLLHMTMCDITGHGVQAAMVVSTCKAVWNTFRTKEPQVLLQRDFIQRYMQLVNKVLFQQGQGRHVVAMAGMTFDFSCSEVDISLAGHPQPLCIRDRTIKTLGKPSGPLGVQAEIELHMKREKILPTDLFLAFTDGLPVLQNTRALKKAISSGTFDGAISARYIYDLIWRFQQDKARSAPDDDTSIVVIRAAS